MDLEPHLNTRVIITSVSNRTIFEGNLIRGQAPSTYGIFIHDTKASPSSYAAIWFTPDDIHNVINIPGQHLRIILKAQNNIQ